MYKKAMVITICLCGLLRLSYVFYTQIKAVAAQLLLEKAWEKHLIVNNINVGIEQQNYNTSHDIKPWPWADIRVVARLTFISQQKEIIVLDSDSGQALAFAPGLSGATPLGDDFPLVISGHNDSHFSLLKDLEIGDEIIIQSNIKQSSTLRVTSVKVIDTRVDNLHLNKFINGKDSIVKTGINSVDNSVTQSLVLLTCYPFDTLSQNTPYRYLVEATEI
jgi:sortase A